MSPSLLILLMCHVGEPQAQEFVGAYVSPFQRSRAIVALALDLQKNHGSVTDHKRVSHAVGYIGTYAGLGPTEMKDILKGFALARYGVASKEKLDFGLGRSGTANDLADYVDGVILLILANEAAVRDGVDRSRLFSPRLTTEVERHWDKSISVRGNIVELPTKLKITKPFLADLSSLFSEKGAQEYNGALREVFMAGNNSLSGD